MTSLDTSLPAAAELEPAKETTGLQGYEAYLERLSERLNPILVKEARQALKSKQFAVTFSLLLFAGWFWTILGVALWSPGIYFSAGGPYLLLGYCIILNVPLMLVVPFSAFRSLASECEQGTFEMMSITTLSSRQIVTGKLGSAVLQMLVYYSAITPCIAFTYMLRGVDVISIFLVLGYTFLCSLLASAIALMMATVTRSQAWQILISVVVLLALAFATFMVCMLSVGVVIEGGLPLDQADFWLANLALLTGHISYMILFVSAAAAQISFPSDNRSTRLRVILLGQQVLFLGWIIFFWMRHQGTEFLAMLLVLSAIHWIVVGAMMIGERAELSPRVRRQLPQSFLGRLFFTWFNPGSGTGYIFVVTNLLVLCAVCIIFGTLTDPFRAPFNLTDWVFMTIYVWCYVVAYLGVSRFVVLFIQRYFYFGLALPFLITLLLVIGGALLPWIGQCLVLGFNTADDYTALQAPNWLFTIAQCIDGDSAVTVGATARGAFIPVPFGSLGLVVVFAAVVLVANGLQTVIEVEQVRQEAPQRVLRDDQELQPAKPAQHQRTSPWDE
jgi:hypothetical protein